MRVRFRRPCSVVSVLTVFHLASCSIESFDPAGTRRAGPYLGQTPPGVVPQLLAPGIVSTGLYTRDVAMTPDGSEFYFGLLESGFAVIVEAKLVNGRWTEPRVAPFSGDPRFMDLEPALERVTLDYLHDLHDAPGIYWVDAGFIEALRPAQLVGKREVGIGNREVRGARTLPALPRSRPCRTPAPATRPEFEPSAVATVSPRCCGRCPGRAASGARRRRPSTSRGRSPTSKPCGPRP